MSNNVGRAPNEEPGSDKESPSASHAMTPAQAWEGLLAWARRLTIDSWIIGAAVFTGMLLCYGKPVRLMVALWNDYSDYYHCGIVPLIVIWLIWRRLGALMAIERKPSSLGLIPLGIGLLLRCFGGEWIPTLSMGSLLFVLLGLIWCYWGTRFARAVLLPVVFLVFMIPVPLPILATAGVPLQAKTTTTVYWLGKLMGLPIIQEGFTLSVYDFEARVVQECSGLHSLFALLMIGTLMTTDTNMAFWKKPVIVILILPIVFVANVSRIFLTVITAVLFGSGAAEGMFHWLSGIILFGMAIIIFLYVRYWFAGGRRESAADLPTSTPLPPIEWKLAPPRW
jgi:exosortase